MGGLRDQLRGLSISKGLKNTRAIGKICKNDGELGHAKASGKDVFLLYCNIAVRRWELPINFEI